MRKSPSKNTTDSSQRNAANPFDRMLPISKPVGAYLSDYTQRLVLFWDVLRQRSEQYYAQKAKAEPTLVLHHTAVNCFANPRYAWRVTVCALLLPSAQALEQISIPPVGLSSSPQPLIAQRFKPTTPGPHPAIVMMHGCGGAYDNKGRLGARQQMWGEYMASQGYNTLILDSFTSRGIKELCTVKFAARTLKEADRVGDAYAALAWLRQQADVDAKRIAVFGWSHGGGVVLDTVTRKPKSARAMEGFKAAISFYPGCTSRNKRAAGFHPYAPLLLLIGESDDWTPAAPCKSLAAAVAARGEPMSIVTYPDTYHDFDHPGLKTKRVRKEVPNGVSPGEGVTTAPNPEAREDAKQRVLAFFAEHLK